MEWNLSEKVAAFCRDHSLDVKLSSEMPAGYETAFGTYDVTVNTLFLNEKLLERAPQWEVLYYLYHELRHAMQYQHPEKFDPKIQESRFYVVLYNGVCFKLTDNCWQECTLEGEDFTQAYLHLPYEMDANNFAYQMVQKVLGSSPELENLYRSWMPNTPWQYEKLEALFRRIDRRLKGED